MLSELEAALDDLVAFIDANEPRIVAYGAYISEDGTHLTVVHVHSDSASLEFHMDRRAGVPDVRRPRRHVVDPGVRQPERTGAQTAS
jgi:hypothetical protein